MQESKQPGCIKDNNLDEHSLLVHLITQTNAYLIYVYGRSYFQAVVYLALVVILNYGLFEHVHRTGLLMPHGNIKGEHAHVPTWYVVDIGVEESQYEAVVLDAGFHEPRLPIPVEELSGLRWLRERIQQDGKHAVDFEQVEAHHELAADLQKLLDLVHAV